jgi:tetratricopeptide (TPR) repeat protein
MLKISRPILLISITVAVSTGLLTAVNYPGLAQGDSNPKTCPFKPIPNPKTANDFFESGLYKSACTEDTRGAISDLSESIRLEPKKDNADGAYWSRYLAYLKLGDYSKALVDINNFISLRPNEPDGYIELGLLQEKRGKNQEAVEAYTKAYQFANQSGEVLFFRGRARLALGDIDKGLKDYRQAKSIIEPMLQRNDSQFPQTTFGSSGLTHQEMLDQINKKISN